MARFPIQLITHRQQYKKMSQFNLWFAYYDSFFLNPNPKLSHQFYTDHILHNINWPIEVCPTLSQIYILLQAFINEPANWTVSKCQVEELEAIQAQVNDLMYFLDLERSYAHTFWAGDERRIQASAVHFYTFLQMLIKAIIPYPTMNLFECKTANKLCIKLPKLEKLMNEILKCINPIAKVLSSPKFAEQSKLIKNFFQNWIYLMKKLPNIKRNKLGHVHKLAKFVCLTNPIEICTVNKSVEYAEAVRKKSNTVGTQIELNTYPPIQNFKSNVRIGFRPEKSKEKKRCNSCVSLVIRDCEGGMPFRQHSRKLFNFPNQILQYARQEENRNKASTISSLSTLKNKKDSITKFRTLTTNETRSYSKQKMESPLKSKRQKSKTYQKSSQQPKSAGQRPTNISVGGLNRTVSKKRRETKFYEQETERNQQILSVRSSKESTIRKRQLSVLTVDKRDYGDSFRGNRRSTVFMGQPKQYSIFEMSFAKSKWDIVRSFLHEKIKMKKIERIIKES